MQRTPQDRMEALNADGSSYVATVSTIGGKQFTEFDVLQHVGGWLWLGDPNDRDCGPIMIRWDHICFINIRAI